MLAWADNILKNMQVKDGNPESLNDAKEWFGRKVTTVKGIWWPYYYGIQYEYYSEAVRLSSYFLEIIDENSTRDIVKWQKVSKDITLKHLGFCLRRYVFSA